MNNKVLAALILLLTLPQTARAITNSPAFVPFQAVITDGADNPITSTAITIVIEITDSVSGCVLYQETHNPTTDSKGVISLAVGTGGGSTYATAAPSFSSTFKNIFRNDGTSVTACIGGGSTTLTAAKGRNIQFNVNGGGMSSGISMGAVGYSYFAEKSFDSDYLGGWPAASYLDVNGTATMASNLNLGGNKIINVTDPTNPQDVATKNYVDTAGSGSVTSASVVSANGFSGSVATPTTTPAITLNTTVTGMLKGNGTAMSAAISGTDYSAGTSALATGIIKSTTGTGVLSIAVPGDFPVLNQNTTGTAANVTGTVALANGGTGSSLAASAGSVAYSSAGSLQLTAVGGAGQVLTSNGAAAPTWTTPSTTDATKLPLAGGTMTGALNMGGFRINNLLDPAALQDAATKNYVDANFATTGSLANYLRLDGSNAMTAGLRLFTWTTVGRPGAPTVGLSGFNTTINKFESWDGASWVSGAGGTGDFMADGSVTMTGGLRFNTWTTGGRPGGPVTGQTGFNTTTGYLETWNGAAWVDYSAGAGGSLSGAGTANRVSKYTGATTLGDSNITDTGALITLAGPVTVSGQLNMSTNKIINLVDGSAAQEAAAFGQIGAAITANNANFVRVDGTSGLTADWDANGATAGGTRKITGLADPTVVDGAATKNYVDTSTTNYVLKAGDTMTGNLTVNRALDTNITSQATGDFQAVLNLNNTNRSWRIINDSSGGVGPGKLNFYDGTASQSRFVIDTAGNVGIGTTTPARLLHVNGPIRITPTALPAGSAGDIAIDSADSNKLKWYDGAVWQTAGGAGGGASLSAANTFTIGAQTIETGAIANKGLIVKGFAGQTANLQEWQNSGGTVLSGVDSLGRVNVLQNATSPSGFNMWGVRVIMPGGNTGGAAGDMGAAITGEISGVNQKNAGLAGLNYNTSGQAVGIFGSTYNSGLAIMAEVDSAAGPTAQAFSAKTNALGNTSNVASFSTLGLGTVASFDNSNAVNGNPVIRITSSGTGDMLEAAGGQFRINNSGAIITRSGTAAPNTAPIYIPSGALLGAAVSGAIENDGANLYYTDSGSTRRTIATTSDLSSYLPLAGGTMNGLANLTWAAGPGAFNMSSSTGTFQTSTGAVTLNGPTTIAPNQNLTMAAGTGVLSVQPGTVTNPSINFGVANTGIYSPGGSQVAISTAATQALLVDNLQRVGIGTAPSHKLDVFGDVNIPSVSTNGYRKNGQIILNHPNNVTNILVGVSAGNTGMTGSNNTAVGNLALTVAGAGTGNTAIGQSAGTANTTGANNTFIGLLSGNANVGQGDNTYVGANSGKGAIAQYGVIMGSSAGGAGSTGLTGSYNTILGYRSGYVITSGLQNVMVGEATGYALTTGNYNTFIGDSAGHAAITTSGNTFLGASSGYNNAAGTNSTYVGYYSGYNATGSSNTLVGYQAGMSLLGGANNTALGNNADFAGATNNAIAIGSGAIVTGNGSVQLGTGTNPNNNTVQFQNKTIANNQTGSTPVWIGNTVGSWDGVGVGGYNGGRIKCEAQFPPAANPGVHMCSSNEIAIGLQFGVIPAGTPWVMDGKYHNFRIGASDYTANDCAAFTSNAGVNGWYFTGSQIDWAGCGTARFIACCR